MWLRQLADVPATQGVDSDVMSARALQEARARLVALRHDELERIAVSALALGASLAATVFYPPLALPLFVGGVAIGVLGVGSTWRHWDLVDRLADDREAYEIPAVRSYAARDARMDRRVAYSSMIRSWTRQDPPADSRIPEVADQLEELARELAAADLDLDPASALACRRFVTDSTVSPLLDETASRDDLARYVARIRAGFTTRG